MASVILDKGSRMTPKEMIEHCRAQIAAVTFPRHWKFVDQFPMMMTGKAQKIHHAPDRNRGAWPAGGGEHPNCVTARSLSAQ